MTEAFCVGRFVEADMLLTYHEGQSALEALSCDQKDVGGQIVNLQLLTPDWKQRIEDELDLVRSNTASLFNTISNSLLGEDFSIPTMSFDLDGRLISPSVPQMNALVFT